LKCESWTTFDSEAIVVASREGVTSGPTVTDDEHTELICVELRTVPVRQNSILICVVPIMGSKEEAVENDWRLN
jgi:hypothetical protein